MTGDITFSDTQVFPAGEVDFPVASLDTAGIVQLTDATDSTSLSLAATANAAKKAFDRGNLGVSGAAQAQLTANQAKTTADAALPTSGGTMTGVIDFSDNQTFPGAGGTVQSVNEVQPNAETGNITLTATDVGALAVVGGTMTGDITFNSTQTFPGTGVVNTVNNVAVTAGTQNVELTAANVDAVSKDDGGIFSGKVFGITTTGADDANIFTTKGYVDSLVGNAGGGSVTGVTAGSGITTGVADPTITLSGTLSVDAADATIIVGVDGIKVDKAQAALVSSVNTKLGAVVLTATDVDAVSAANGGTFLGNITVGTGTDKVVLSTNGNAAASYFQASGGITVITDNVSATTPVFRAQTGGTSKFIVDGDGSLRVGADINTTDNTGTNFRVEPTGDVVATSFTGNGAGLTNVSATDPNALPKAGGDMSGNINMNTASQPVIVFSPNQTFPSDITPDPDNLPDATLNSPGIVQLSSAVDSDVETKASTPKATKEAFDKGVTALNAANSAASAATTAKNTADAAQADATTAKNTADAAQADATSALTNAATADAKAVAAQTDADAAQADATTAIAAAATAQAAAVAAQGTADTAVTNAATADAKAVAAQGTADTAVTAAATADAKAVAAQTDATQGITDAATAQAAAVAAQGTADTAVTNAATAQAAAVAAQTDATQALADAAAADVKAVAADAKAVAAQQTADAAQTTAGIAATAAANAQIDADAAIAAAAAADAKATTAQTTATAAMPKAGGTFTGDITTKNIVIESSFKISGDGSGLTNLNLPPTTSFKGTTDVTTDTAPSAVAGDTYLNTVSGAAGASWTGIATETVQVNQFVIYGTEWETASVLDNSAFVTIGTDQTVTGAKNFTGNLQVPTTPAGGSSAASKSYVDTEIAAIDTSAGTVQSVNSVDPDAGGNVTLTAANVGAIGTTGGVMTGNLTMSESDGSVIVFSSQQTFPSDIPVNPANLPDASANQKGITLLSDSTTSTKDASQETAATPVAVKTAKDAADAAEASATAAQSTANTGVTNAATADAKAVAAQTDADTAIQTAQAAQNDATQGINDAATAQAAAVAAQGTADTAVTNAATAQAAAVAAQTTADTGVANAATADAKAVAAQTTADTGVANAATADAKAVAAQTDATQALADAVTADAKAVAAQGDATTAIADAATAQAAAVAAQSTADTGVTNAATAQAAAVAAQGTANTAVTNAATADAKAVAAQGDATTALTNAATADAKAVAAQGDATTALTNAATADAKAVAADAKAVAAQTTADAALPKAGGTMSGTLTSQNITIAENFVISGDGSGLTNLTLPAGITYEGTIDCVTQDPASTPAAGQMYLNIQQGAAKNTWAGLATQTVELNQFILFDGTNWDTGAILDGSAFVTLSTTQTIPSTKIFTKAVTVGEPTAQDSATTKLYVDTTIGTEIGNIDFPVDSVNGETGAVTVTPANINAMSLVDTNVQVMKGNIDMKTNSAIIVFDDEQPFPTDIVPDTDLLPHATVNAQGITQLYNGVDSSSDGTDTANPLAATPGSVKTAYDKAIDAEVDAAAANAAAVTAKAVADLAHDEAGEAQTDATSALANAATADAKAVAAQTDADAAQVTADAAVPKVGNTNITGDITIDGDVTVTGTGHKFIGDGSGLTNLDIPAAIQYKGTINCVTETAPASPQTGWSFLNTGTGIADSSWTGLQNVIAEQFVLYNGNQWETGAVLDDAVYVTLATTQSVTGSKTFTSQVLIPETPTQNAAAASKKYVDDEIQTEFAKVDFPVTTVNGQAKGIDGNLTGAVTLTSADVGALPTTGGTDDWQHHYE